MVISAFFDLPRAGGVFAESLEVPQRLNLIGSQPMCFLAASTGDGSTESKMYRGNTFLKTIKNTFSRLHFNTSKDILAESCRIGVPKKGLAPKLQSAWTLYLNLLSLSMSM